MKIESYKIVLFDGVCNLCNSSVQFIIKRDSKDQFRFAALQEEAGLALINKYSIDTLNVDSIILIEDGKVFVKSTAVLRIAKALKGTVSLLYFFMIVPNFIRNCVYEFIAKNRYKWYGKKDACMIPTPALKAKFL